MAKRTARCTHCEAEYITSRSDSRFCSSRCSYQSRIGKQYRRTCAGGCGTDIAARHYNAKFCEACYALRPSTVHQATQDAKRPWYSACKSCGMEFDEPRQQEHCNFRCVGRYIRRQQLAVTVTKVCVGCGEDFTTQDNRRTTCGTGCRQWLVSHPGVMRVLDRECLHCGTPFRALTAKQKYCRPSCCATANKIRRRGRMASAFVDDVHKIVIAKRDRWICQLCGSKVSKTLRAPHPHSWSIDHVIPIAAGGEHSYANTQLAHLGCNVAKGHRTTQAVQLALIG